MIADSKSFWRLQRAFRRPRNTSRLPRHASRIHGPRHGRGAIPDRNTGVVFSPLEADSDQIGRLAGLSNRFRGRTECDRSVQRVAMRSTSRGNALASPLLTLASNAARRIFAEHVEASCCWRRRRFPEPTLMSNCRIRTTGQHRWPVQIRGRAMRDAASGGCREQFKGRHRRGGWHDTR